jgi:hypothetical protein
VIDPNTEIQLVRNKKGSKMKIKRNLHVWSLTAVMALTVAASARENGASGGRRPNGSMRVTTQDQLAASCTPATAKTDLEINNVRTTIMTGGDMWWDLNNAKYEVPKGSKAHSVFAGALWIGGLDAGGQLKVAAMTYRQTGNDFWPGPLDTTTVSIDGAVCNSYDRHWKITRKEVEDFYAYTLGQGPSGYTVPLVIQNWPGNGDAAFGQGKYLAPFVDVNGDGFYDYTAGDYPAFDVAGNLGCSKNQIYGDQCLWWVFNDKGNVHSESGAQAIGLEIHAQAFAFSTNDEINNMTFYSYKIINRSTVAMNNTYFGQWTDADLGDYLDDYVGCDVARGLGYTYNGDANDGASAQPTLGTYGANPPAIGMDFFEGPIADPGDGKDNDRDGTVDEVGEQIIMSKFVYYNNDFTIIGNPENATHFYNYLSGFWKDGSPLTYGGNAYGGSLVCDFMFPGDTDPQGWGTNFQPQPAWDEASVGNTPADRRMLQSAGPFTLQPGAINYITVGAVWARAASGGPAASVALMRVTDDKAQRLFDNCFRTLDGPDAPDITIQELDKELLIYLSNKETGNNYLNSYEAFDPGIVYSNVAPGIDTTYNFEGYQIFQLKDATVTTADIYNPDKARLIYQCDVKNGVTNLVNREFDQALNADVPKDMTLQANDEGIFNSFQITEDAFATGDRRLINHKTYYYMAVSYAYNNYIQYSDVSFDPLNATSPSNIGQKKPYLAGRRNIKVYTAIPHIPSPEAGGTNQQAVYGSGPKLTRLEGTGHGQNILELTQSSIDAILNATTVNNGGTSRVDQVTYENGAGPVNIKVIDPLNVPEGEFTIQIINNPNNRPVVVDTARWVLTQTSPVSRSWSSDTTLNIYSTYFNEQIIPELGMSVTLAQVNPPGFTNGLQQNPIQNGFLSSSMTFTDPTKDWLSGIQDDDSNSEYNWIRAGTTSGTGVCVADFNDRSIGATFIDADAQYEKVVNGTWGPYRLVADNISPTATQPCYAFGPGFPNATTTAANRFENVSSIDVVFTNDRSKWSRVPVFEVGPNPQLNQGLTQAFFVRNSPSVDKYGRTGDGVVSNDPNDADFISATGMSWFPGYVINVETGERLNMAFAENSAMVAERGRDMLWNPTSTETGNLFESRWGGLHYLYVFGHNGNGRFPSGPLGNELRDVPAYDCGQMIMKIMTSSAAATERTEVFRDAMWVNVPMLDEDFSTWNFGNGYQSDPVLPTDVKVKIRVAKPYKKYLTGVQPNANNPALATDSVANPQNGNNPMYSFNTNDLKVQTANLDAAKNALDLINVVPNPYYAYSEYERNQLDNRVKFTNLPEKCTIRIYTVNGTMVRRITKDSPQTYVDWDLKNQANIPVASGLYIVHVEVPGVGEKILKWFGVMRPADLDAY